MNHTEKMAIAAHLHVLLRRTTGRVTDTEWLAVNADYASEIIRHALDYAQRENHVQLAELAVKLADLMRPAPAPAKASPPRVSESSSIGHSFARYVHGIR